MDTLEAPKWLRRRIREIRTLTILLAVCLIQVAIFVPSFFNVSMLASVVGLFLLYIYSLSIDPVLDWEGILSRVKGVPKDGTDEVVVDTYLSECYYDLWKEDMLLENNDSAKMAVFTSPSTENKTVGSVDELIKCGETFYLKKSYLLKRYDGKKQLCVMLWKKEDTRMKKYLKMVDVMRYVEVYGDK